MTSRQFDIHRNSGARGPGEPAFLVNLQSDSVSLLATVIVAPAWKRDRPYPSPELAVHFVFESSDWTLSIAEIAFVRRRDLGAAVGNLSDHRDRIIRSVDRLFTGI